MELLSLRDGEAGVNLADYDVLVCVGQGIGGAENIARAEKLAEKLGGTLAASRPMVDAGILPYARQVGQTGKSVAPKLYLALGVSGAIHGGLRYGFSALHAHRARPKCMTVAQFLESEGVED